ncbi:S8 family peptidase [Chelativorans salis]|uniref:S8 family serine peptidase n=1 Tax=Chelativorans salis TaxID=2978478 RepID=A0ABT2LIM8_9HYPH|nr:S8 family peptidase [Chelativorans sp. EGI FJ00035]MCT7374385.1 S8 family serine peptidase [Chelativorans sp. EGI FJ00035]
MRDFTLRLIAGATFLLVAGCGGGGSNSDSNGGSSPPDDEPPASSSDYPVMNETAAASYAATSEFKGVDPSCSGSRNPGCSGTTNYALQNIHYAHTATLDDGTRLRGKGTLIAVVDDGFRRSHREFSGKTIHTFFGGQSFATEDHGTGVAGVAAGNADGNEMMGVAPEADLHLTSWESVSNTSGLLDHLAAATDDAASRGAVVQNNSWGFAEQTAADEEMAAFEASDAESYAEYLAGGNTSLAADWQNLFEAYDNFQETGVVVFANSNNQNLGAADDGESDASSWAALPLFVPELSEAWLAVSNARFTVDESDGSILDAELQSAPCGSAARFCLTSEGYTYAPTASSNTSYGVATGTSFAAPQVSGQIALLAQAFPNLSPAEWTVRLLATARTGWDGFQNSKAGEQTFAPGVKHAYSSLYGHGVPDIKAALSPVGGLAIASGDNVFSGPRTSLDEGIATAGPVVGNAIAKTLAKRDIMAVDALGTDFYLPGRALGAEGANGGFSSGQANAGQLARNVEGVATSFSFLEAGSIAVPALEDAAVPKLFFSQTLANLGGDTAFSHVFPLGEGRFLQFAGHMEQVKEGSSAAFSLSRLTARENFATELSFSFGHSANRFFGNAANGPFLPAEDTGNVAAGFSISTALSSAWSVGAYAEFGSGFVGDDPSALVDYGAFAYASGGLSARRRGVITGRDTLDLYAGLRPKTVAGKADLSLPVGRDTDGTIHYEEIGIDLAKADLPLRLGFVYRNRTASDFDVLFGLNTDFVAGSDPDPVLSVSLGLKKKF